MTACVPRIGSYYSIIPRDVASAEIRGCLQEVNSSDSIKRDDVTEIARKEAEQTGYMYADSILVLEAVADAAHG